MGEKNQVTIEGNLTRDVEVKYANSGTAIARLSIAYNDNYKKGDEWIKETSFFDVVAFKALAESCAHLTKGTLVHIEGKLKQDRFEREGKKESRVNIIAFKVESLGNGSRSSGNNSPTGPQGSPTPRPNAPSSPRPQPAYVSPPSDDSSIPF